MTDLQARVIEMPLRGTFRGGLRGALAILAEKQGAEEYVNLTNKEFQALLGVSHNTFDSHIRELVELGLVTRTPHAGMVRTALVPSAVTAWKNLGPMSEQDALQAGHPELALAMQLSGYVYPDRAPENEKDWDEVRPEWAVFCPHFANLLKRYEYDVLEDVLGWALYDGMECHPYRFGPSKYVKGMRLCAPPTDDYDAGEEDSWRCLVLFVEGGAEIDLEDGTLNSPEEMMRAIASYLPQMITASTDCDALCKTQIEAFNIASTFENKRIMGAGKIRRRVHLIGDASQCLQAIVGAHRDDHLLSPDPDPENSYVWESDILSTSDKNESHRGLSLDASFVSRFYLVHRLMFSDNMQGYTHTEIRHYEGGTFKVLFEGPV